MFLTVVKFMGAGPGASEKAWLDVTPGELSDLFLSFLSFFLTLFFFFETRGIDELKFAIAAWIYCV